MKQAIALVVATISVIAAFSQLPDRAQIKKLGIERIESYSGRIISEMEYDKQGYEIKQIMSGEVISESSVYYNKQQKPDSIIIAHTIFGPKKEIYKYSATGDYRIITVDLKYKRTDTLFLDKTHRKIRQAWSDGKKALYKYNAKSQLLQIIESKPSGDQLITSFEYDQKGRQTSSRQVSGNNKIEYQTAYTYDADGKRLTESQSDGDGKVYSETKYQYNAEKGLPSAKTGKFLKIETRTSYEYYFF